MKAKSHYHVFQCGSLSHRQKIHLAELANKSIPLIGTCSFVAGIGAATIGINPASDYLLSAGVLFHLVSRFGDWWQHN